MFCKTIYQLFRQRHKFNYAISFFDVIPNETVPNHNVFRPRNKYRIFGEVCGDSVIAFYHDNFEINSVITQMLFHPANLHTKVTHNDVFDFNYG